MIYTVLLTEQAKRDLQNLHDYIAFSLLEPGVAKKLTRRITDGLQSLSEMPSRYPLYQDEPWKSKGLRRINIGKYSGFYFITENTVQVIRIFYGGRDINSILNETPC